MGRIYRDEQILRNIGRNIKQLLKDKNIKQDVFLFDTGVHATRATSGTSNMTISTLKKIADYLQVEISELTK